MSRPSIGRIVHYKPGEYGVKAGNGQSSDEPVTALVVRVWGEGETPALNLRLVVDGAGELPWATSVQHVSEVAGSGSPSWDWPERVE